MSLFETRTKARRKTELAQYAQRMRRQATASEHLLWRALRGRALGVQFRRQVCIGGSFIADFVASEIGLVVEVDGGYHAQRVAADTRRDLKLHHLGFTVLHLSGELVEHQLPVALQRIRLAIAELSAATPS